MNDVISRLVRRPGTTIYLGIAVVLAMAVALLASCGEEQTRLELQSLEQAPGGQPAALESLQVDGDTVLVAPIEDRLFFRRTDESNWNWIPAEWPSRVDEDGLNVFDVVAQAGSDARLSPRRYFTVFENEIWTVALPAAGQRPMLLRSADVGESWEQITLPEDLEESRPETLGRSATMPAIHLMTHDESLYLIDGQRVWRKDPGQASDDADAPETSWVAISLQGTPVAPAADTEDEVDRGEERQNGPQALPKRARHYLPATGAHPFEVVTIHGENLQIYRRGTDEDDFERVSTLDGVDRDVIRDPTGEFWFIAASHAIYRSGDDGETWEEFDVPRDSLAPEYFSQIRIFEDDAAETGYQLWVMGDAGSIWRSDDAAENWQELMERDPDGRGLTGLVRDEAGNRWWAATSGTGILRSTNSGDWEESNQGLSAGTTFNALFAGDDRILVGADSGLYERSADTVDGGWRRVDDRATSAVYLDQDEETTISGTLGGSIVVRTGGEEGHTSEAAPLGTTDEILFAPPHLRRVPMDPSAIVTLTARPESRDIIAWSHRQGPLISNDGGSSWRRMPLGDAFRTALESGVITDFIATREQVYFAVTRSRHPGQPTQLWRSVDGGQTWQTTYSFMEGDKETPMQLVRLPDDQGLLMAHGSRLAASTDMGSTWTTVSGPWESGALTGMAVHGDQVVVVMHLAHTSEIAWLDNPMQGAEVTKRYRLSWPEDRGLDSDRPVGIALRGDRVLLNESGSIYSAQLPRRRTSGPGSMSIMAALGTVIVLITLAFGYLRVWER